MVETKSGAKFVTATFRLPRIDGAERAHVVGEFNDWSTTANPMRRDDDGFTTEIKLEPGRTYRFRYLLDDERWENDWNADAYVPNEFGGEDSVIDLSAAAASAPKRRTARAATGDGAPATKAPTTRRAPKSPKSS